MVSGLPHYNRKRLNQEVGVCDYRLRLCVVTMNNAQTCGKDMTTKSPPSGRLKTPRETLLFDDQYSSVPTRNRAQKMKEHEM